MQFAHVTGDPRGQRVLGVGARPGALTAEPVNQASPAQVRAVEPSVSFADAVRERLPGVGRFGSGLPDKDERSLPG